MKALAAAGVLMALAGCGMLPARLPPQTPDQAACAAKAEEDPQVKLLIIKGLGNASFRDENQETLRLARADASRACLVSRGAVRPGGVERQKPL
jgi:hypothetical protein